jgi:alpha-D-ribose 1-methylphosphonate 5-triphosphate synthase subunit PhnH
MMRIFQPRLETLPTGQQQVWTRLRPAALLGFALNGGTAIALRLGHRTSVDFDFSLERPLDRDAMHDALPFLANATVVQDRQDSLTVLVPVDDPQHENVKVSFFGAIDFGQVGEPDLTEDGVLQVASLDDLMATNSR